jgi:thymidylate synthase (FAD)
MKIIEQYHGIISVPKDLLQTLEKAGRTCYKSEDKITSDSAEKFVSMLINRGHHAMIEFGDIIVKFVTNRGVTHELVRHRLCSFAQESTRYVNYGGDDIQFINPVWAPGPDDGSDNYVSIVEWEEAMIDAEHHYKELIAGGWRPEQAREVLPNSLKTEIVVKGNIREWRHIFTLRCSKAAHPQMRALMIPCLQELQGMLSIVFDDIEY